MVLKIFSKKYFDKYIFNYSSYLYDFLFLKQYLVLFHSSSCLIFTNILYIIVIYFYRSFNNNFLYYYFIITSMLGKENIST